jgi:indolepyruvate decarboxylase
MKETIGNFLIRRLQEVGIEHIFGVPGDYNLELMQQLEDRGEPAWIGNCNELNASYAADGYARIKGLGALIVTNGVGALSAINGVAGAYSEHVPVICICGSIPTRSVQRGDLMHHTLADPEKGNFSRAFAEVTAAQAVLSAKNAATEIDRLILTSWRRKLPVYMELPSDLAYTEIEVPDEPLKLAMTPSDKECLQSCVQAILKRLNAARSPAFLLDLDADRFGAAKQITELAERRQMRVATLNTCKALFNEASPLFLGTYSGIASAPATRDVIEQSDCLITVGYRRIESTSGFFTDKIPESAITVNSDHVDVDATNYQGVNIADLMQALLESNPAFPRAKILRAGSRQSDVKESSGLLTQTAYWNAMQEFIREGDVIIAEDGTSLIGAGQMNLPQGCTFISQAVWGSVGYATGALLGTLLAAPDRRHVLFTGEGALQLTAQEISTILRHDLKPFIFVINNQGYTMERTILGKDAKYNDVADWRYSELPHVFCRNRTAETYVVETIEDLQNVLEAPHEAFVLVESVMDRHDSPVDLIRGGHGLCRYRLRTSCSTNHAWPTVGEVFSSNGARAARMRFSADGRQHPQSRRFMDATRLCG